MPHPSETRAPRWRQTLTNACNLPDADRTSRIGVPASSSVRYEPGAASWLEKATSKGHCRKSARFSRARRSSEVYAATGFRNMASAIAVVPVSR